MSRFTLATSPISPAASGSRMRLRACRTAGRPAWAGTLSRSRSPASCSTAGISSARCAQKSFSSGHERPGRPGRGPCHLDHQPAGAGRADVGNGGGREQIRDLTAICAYDSLNTIDQTQNTGYAMPPFELALMEAAQRIAGLGDKTWAIVNDIDEGQLPGRE